MRNYLIGLFALALAGITFGCGSSEEGTTVVVPESTAGYEYKPAPAPAPVFHEDEFDDEDVDVDVDEGGYEIEVDD